MATPALPVSAPPVARTSPAPRLHAAWERVVIVAFVAVLALPGVGTIAGLDLERVQGENREELAGFPGLALDWQALVAFPNGFTRYFEDHFAFRARLVRWQAAARFLALRISPAPTVIRGCDRWLFYADDGAVEDYTVSAPLSAGDLEVWRATLQHTQDWLQSRGVAYLFVIAPDKHVIYSEFMPASIHRLREVSRIDQLVEHLRAYSTVRVLDLRPSLLAASRRERIYHRTDTHWNDRGALVAYQQIMEWFGAEDGLKSLGMKASPRSAFDAREVLVPGMDLAGMMGLGDVLTETDLTLSPRRPRVAQVVEPLHPDPYGIEARLVTERSDPQLPRAVVFRDSFGSALIPFLSEHFSRAVYLWQYDVDPGVIALEHPQVVIQEWVGRRLSTLLPYDAVAEMPAQPAAGGALVSRTAVGRTAVSSTGEARR